MKMAEVRCYSETLYERNILRFMILKIVLEQVWVSRCVALVLFLWSSYVNVNSVCLVSLT
jgi:hypothetical protein